ncbi:hypothetical protein R3P38DRAFT_3214924 [Favolaschia claudopus]|uniref:Uncharacterized protein n=1 Tax=Favolaschia claudopus TaxID=2862362 RepID=A0AAW0AA64_9AGAR
MANPNASICSSALSSPPSTPALNSSLENYLVENDWSGYSADVFRDVLNLQSPTRADDGSGGLIFPNPNPQGGSAPEEDLDEVEADREADQEEDENEDEDEEEEEDEEDEDEEYQLEDSSPIRPPPGSTAKQPLRREGFHSNVPLRLPPRADEPQLGGGYPRLEAEPLPPDQQPSTRLRRDIRASARANADAIALHTMRAATTHAPEPPSAPPIASTSAAPAADQPPPPRPTTPTPAPPPKVPSRQFIDSPSKLARSTSIEPSGESIAQGRAAPKPHSRSTSVKPQLFTKKELRARRAAKAAAEATTAMGTVEEDINLPPPPPHSNMWEAFPIPPPPNRRPPPQDWFAGPVPKHNTPPPNYGTKPTAPTAEVVPPSAEVVSPSAEAGAPSNSTKTGGPAGLFEDDGHVEYASHPRHPSAVTDDVGAMSDVDPATPADNATSEDERSEGRSLTDIAYEVEEVEEAEEASNAGEDIVMVPINENTGRHSKEHKDAIHAYVVEVKQLCEVYHRESNIPMDRLYKALVEAISPSRRSGNNGWNIYQGFATDPRNAMTEYKRFNTKFTSNDPEKLPQFTPAMLSDMYSLFKKANPNGRAKQALEAYEALTESEKTQTIISRQRLFDKFREGFKSMMEDLDEKKFNAIAFVVGRFVHDDLELGEVIATPALAESFSSFFKDPETGAGYSNSDLLGVAKICALVHQASNEFSKGTVIPAFAPAPNPARGATASTSAKPARASAATASTSAEPVHTFAATSATSATSATEHLGTSAPEISTPADDLPAVVVKEEEEKGGTGGKRAYQLDWRLSTGTNVKILPNKTEDLHWLQDRFNSMSQTLFKIEFFSRGTGNTFPWHTLPRLLARKGYRIVGWPDNIRLPATPVKGRIRGWEVGGSLKCRGSALRCWSLNGLGMVFAWNAILPLLTKPANMTTLLFSPMTTASHPPPTPTSWTISGKQAAARSSIVKNETGIYTRQHSTSSVQGLRPSTPVLRKHPAFPMKEDKLSDVEVDDEEEAPEAPSRSRAASKKQKSTSKPTAEVSKPTAKVATPTAKVATPTAEASGSSKRRPQPKPVTKPVAKSNPDAMDVDEGKGKAITTEQESDDDRPLITVDDHNGHGYLDPDDSEYVEAQPKVKKPKGKAKAKGGKGKGKEKEKQEEKEKEKDSKRPRSPTSSDFFAPDVEEVERPAKKAKADTRKGEGEVARGTSLGPSAARTATSAAPTATSANANPLETKDKKVTFDTSEHPLDPKDGLAKKMARQAARRPIPPIPAVGDDGRTTRSRTAAKSATVESTPEEPTVTPAYIRASPPPNTYYKGVMYSTNGEATPIGTVVEETGTRAHYLIPPRAAPSAPSGGSSSSAAAAAPFFLPSSLGLHRPSYQQQLQQPPRQQVAEAQQRMTAASAAGAFTMDLVNDYTAVKSQLDSVTFS